VSKIKTIQKKPLQKVSDIKVVIPKEKFGKNKLWLFGIVLVGLLLSMAFHYNLAMSGKDYYPYNTFLFDPGDRFNDFNNIFNASSELNPFQFAVSVYFPLTYQLMHALCIFPVESALQIFLFTFFIFFIWYCFVTLRKFTINNIVIALIVLGLLNYPMMFVVDRANLELWIFMSIAGFLIAYDNNHNVLACLFLSIAISMKLYPALLGVLFITDKKYKYILYTAVITMGLTTLSAATLVGGISGTISGLSNCLKAFNAGYMSGGTSGLQHNTSMFVPLKLMYYAYYSSTGKFPVGYEQVFNKYYLVFAICVLSFVLFVVFKYKAERWKQVALLVISFIMLPQVSFDYKLVNLLIPIILFLGCETKSKKDLILSILFGLLLIPKDYYIIVSDLSIATVINPILLFSTLIFISFDVMKNKRLNSGISES